MSHLLCVLHLISYLTHKKCGKMKYAQFGLLLANARRAAGFAQQSELAEHLQVKQQTISRWERGESRPKLDKLKQIVEKFGLVEEGAAELIKVAGYDVESKPQTSFDLPLPLIALSEVSFERFCAAVLSKMHPGAVVNRFGDSGHKQDGIDIEVKLTNGEKLGCQCKRHASFGPQKVTDAISACSYPANKKIIMLASTASPDARKAIAAHGTWELWDREDITRKFRHELPMVAQKSIVDAFFKGQRRALLGELEPSPWRSSEEFFAGATSLNDGFSQDWQLVGRSNEIHTLEAFAKSDTSVVHLVTANGGAGKTRLLRALADNLTTERYPAEIYFLSREGLTSKAFDELGPGPKLLICDDAHERDDIALISEYVANPASNAKLILALRPYGLSRLKQQAKWLMLADAGDLRLSQLPLAQLTDLAKEALRYYKADEAYAEQLAKHTRDCPLATVLGAKILGRKNSHPALLWGEDSFRGELMARITTQVVEDVSAGMDPRAVRQTLSSIALLQPLQDGDQGINDTIAKVTNQQPYEVSRIIKRLMEAGVLFSRAEKLRIAPDLLGDFLIEDLCIDASGSSTGFAEKVFDVLEGTNVTNLLLNLGRLDWKKSNGDTRHSRVMNELWGRLKWENEFYSPDVDAAASVAYYQPREALAFARRLIAEQHTGESVAKIVENAAYNYDFLPEACELLWSLGRADNRAENRHPHHGMRILKELATPRPDKPIAYVSFVVGFAFELMSADENWACINTPVDILEGALSTEGHITSSTMRAITMEPFIISQKAVEYERKRIVRALIELLSHPDSRRAVEAARALGYALRFPHGPFGAQTTDENRANWAEEFRQTLVNINEFLDQNKIAPTALTQLAESVSWHAYHFRGATTSLAQQIIDRMDNGLHDRTIRLLIDGWGHMTRKLDDAGNYVDHEKMLSEVVQELISEFPEADALRHFLEDCLAEIALARAESHGAAFILIGKIAASSALFARELVTHARSSPQSLTASYASLGLAELLRVDYKHAAPLVEEILAEGDGPRLWVVADAYSRFQPPTGYSETDCRALRQVVKSMQKQVLFRAADAAHQAYMHDKELGLNLFSEANFSVDEHVAHNFLLWVVGGGAGPFSALSSRQIDAMLQRLNELATLDDHWVQEFIKESLLREPEITLLFLMRRLELAAEQDNWKLSPLLMRYRNQSMEFGRRSDAPAWLERILDWALERCTNVVFKGRLGEFVSALYGTFDDRFTATLEFWGFNKSRLHFEILTAILNEAHNSFVFEKAGFVKRFLGNAHSLGDETLRSAISALFGSSISGMRQGTPGEPFPEDVTRFENAQKMLSNMSRTEPAYKLYDSIMREAKRSIDAQVREGRLMLEIDADSA